ncbi:MAG: glycosyltransferase [Candidatus Pacebacteria bacterium]|nr:glycosyltransferase [Candidatus Paceibacterota bacterium]
MKLSLVITIFNEENTLNQLLTAIEKQTITPTEIIITDGGSSDNSLKVLEKIQQEKFFKNKLKIFIKKGNRSLGRNWAIKQTANELIAITDAGCIPQKNWLEKLVEKYQQTKSPVIAGYYYGLANNSFEQAVIPYVLVMPDKVNENNFLPATRSMLITKKAWKKAGGFNETLNHNEDYAFAHQLVKNNIQISFAKEAQVGWLPRTNLNSFIKMIYRFAYGDAEANLFRPKVALIFIRYFLVFLLLFFIFLNYLFKFSLLLTNFSSIVLILLFFSYCLWAIKKNLKYVKIGWYWLPVLQITSDLAVITGTVSGLLVN